jgi:hypothetical protein
MTSGLTVCVEHEPLPQPTKFEADPRLALLKRVVVSEHFVKSPKLVKFLTYICEQVIAGNGAFINEQAVGMEVFGRPPGYDSNDDNIVRAHASRLRQKLEAYFHAEGRAEQLHIVIPRGCYVPTFCEPPVDVRPTVGEIEPLVVHAPEPPATIAIEAVAASSVDPSRRARGVRQWLITLGCCVVCVVATAILMRQRHEVNPPPLEQPNHAIWSALSTGNRLLLIPGDSSLDIYNNAAGHTTGVSDYITGTYRSELTSTPVMNAEELRRIASRRLTTIVDLRVVSRILRRPEANENVSVVYARDLRPSDLKQGNSILIGSQEANPWVELFEDQLNFNIVPDQKTKVFTVVNRSPRQGEQTHYESGLTSPNHLAYGLIACVPNLSGKGYVLIVQGTAMAGTEAAVDFALTKSELSELLHLHTLRDGKIPKFEVLLQTSSLNGEAPSAKVVTSRVY